MSGKPTPTYRQFKVDDNFSRQARRPGGPPRNAAIARAQAELAQLKPRLEGYVKAESERLAKALLAAQMRDEAYTDHVGQAYDASRNIRDVADSIGYELLGFIATNLCTVIETADAARIEYPADIIDCHREAFALALSSAYLNKTLEELPELFGGLLKIAKAAARRAGFPDTETKSK